MKKISILIFTITFLYQSPQAQILKPGKFHFGINSEGTSDRQLGNAMVDMISRDYLLFAGSGFGLNRTIDGGASWTAFTARDYGGKNGITALTFMDDSTLWIATAFDTTVREEENLDAGGTQLYTRFRENLVSCFSTCR